MRLPERSVVIVTDAECSSALSCIRTLGRSGYHVFAVGSDLAPAASVSRYVKKYFQTASPWSDGIRFLQQLNQIRDQVSADFIL
ncbi:MAG: hypothetical protein RJB13_1551, partial [Pseudomonadota bacterium]